MKMPSSTTTNLGLRNSRNSRSITFMKVVHSYLNPRKRGYAVVCRPVALLAAVSKPAQPAEAAASVSEPAL